MPHFTLQVENKGPMLNAMISVSEARFNALSAADMPIPNGVPAQGLVDTGASCTCIDHSIVDRSGLEPSGEATLVTPSTIDEAMTTEQYDIGIGLAIFAGTDEPPHLARNLPVIATPLVEHQGFHALIGRDVLSRYVLIYNGVLGAYTLAF